MTNGFTAATAVFNNWWLVESKEKETKAHSFNVVDHVIRLIFQMAMYLLLLELNIDIWRDFLL